MASKRIIALRIEDIRAREFEHDHFKVIHMTNTIEWQIGQYLSSNDVEWILARKEVKLEVVPMKD